MRRHRPILAFTLVELLVSITITLVIVVVLFQVFAATARQWQTSDQRIDTFRDARAILQIMARDLSRADINGNASMLMLADYFTVAPDPQFAKEAYAITPIPNAGKSSLCAVGYYCAYDGATHAYSLRRLYKNSNVTYTALARPTPDFTALYTKNPSMDPTDLTRDDVAAGYVWDLQFHPGVGKDFVDPSSVPSSQWNWLEIRFKSMSPASGRLIRNTAINTSTWFDSTSSIYKTFILPYEQQFISRVTLRQNQ